jgi:hypothetical protein
MRDATEKMIVAQAQRDRLQQHLQRLDPLAAAEAAAAAEAIAGGSGSESGGISPSAGDDVITCQLERIAELEREVKRLKQVSRCASRRRHWLGLGLLVVAPANEHTSGLACQVHV